MALNTLFASAYLTIAYDYANDWLYANWTGEQDYDSVHAGCLHMLEVLKQERCHKVLNDNREVTSMWSEAAEWGGTVWFPLMADAGLEYFAWVYSPNHYSRLSTDLMLSHTTRPLVLAFNDAAIAQAWLRQM
ncbi:hypothetical protein LJ737_05760 [Hymenobacter sp. 15J16-1T3B]|uniref:hypothetical protein n=1 Tax=Hymenobacter sp. 15J16-1T3B TaxID=2886941 RepID=UPI001D10FCAB|nr:hypothetical protein [Hymenobacter sp. 15J16-1T3B]MCC3156734.1 hypothetical protein [Hymenobacter sp. 15J16-1T3B]